MLFKKKVPTTKIKWYSASMPPETETKGGEINFVLIHVQNGLCDFVRVGYYSKQSRRWLGVFGNGIEFDEPNWYTKVINWAPLPEPPVTK